jgi:hypothetical protein
MSIVAVLALLLGAVLGMRFKVLILLPVIACAVIIIATGGIASGAQGLPILVMAVLASICLQLGYFTGVMTRYVTLIARAGRSAKISRQVETVR